MQSLEVGRPEADIGCCGRAAIDVSFPHAEVTFHGCVAEIRFHHRVIQIHADTPLAPGCKVVAPIPPELWEEAADRRLGGGIVNFCFAHRQITRRTSLRYLDACRPGQIVGNELDLLHVASRFLGFRACPINPVFRVNGDKFVIKSEFEPAASLSDGQRSDITWLCEPRAVVLSSPADVPVVEQVAYERKLRKFSLYIVPTKAFPADITRRVILPVADVIIAAWDELDGITGLNFGGTIEGAVTDLFCVARQAPRSVIYVTLSGDGVLVWEPGASAPVHVRLRGRRAAEVRVWVASGQANVCGAGDAFSAGVVTALESGESVLSGRLPRSSARYVAAALAGCASAVRWLGFQPVLTAQDFDVSPIPVTGVTAVA